MNKKSISLRLRIGGWSKNIRRKDHPSRAMATVPRPPKIPPWRFVQSMKRGVKRRNDRHDFSCPASKRQRKEKVTAIKMMEATCGLT
jgi:hypothetical protein